jgi:hypothetical protein
MCSNGHPAAALQNTSIYDYVSILKVEGERANVRVKTYRRAVSGLNYADKSLKLETYSTVRQRTAFCRRNLQPQRLMGSYPSDFIVHTIIQLSPTYVVRTGLILSVHNLACAPAPPDPLCVCVLTDEFPALFFVQTLRILRLFKFLKGFQLLVALKNLKITT